jgi:crotonobetainyl-CoA:carnitine CoA-transferase CaiB-like acyl-CoA transferase
VADVFDDPQIQAQNMVIEMEQPGHGPIRMLGFPMKFVGSPCTVRRPAPELGQHSDEVLAELGFAKSQVRALRDAGVI